MWTRAWGCREGAVIGFGLLLAGILLQVVAGPIDWQLFAWPLNLVALLSLLGGITAMHLLRGRVYCFKWLGSGTSAVASLAFTAGVTIVMGLVRQVPYGSEQADVSGLNQMISAWPFVLTYLWLTLALGLTILRAGLRLQWRSVCFQLNHSGLFIALTAAVLGAPDMQRLQMTAPLGQPEWRATDQRENIVELPLAIELHEFTIDEYAPKLMLIDNAEGKALPSGQPQHILLEDDCKGGRLGDWQISVTERIPEAAAVATVDTVRYTAFKSMGASYAAHLKAVNLHNGAQRQGWVSCGSFMFPYHPLRLDDSVSIVMPEREARRFASNISVYTKQGERFEGVVEVNKPLEVHGWKIYQLSYDETKGRWSDVSVFELVSDPWLPLVYTGIFMMMAGALGLIISAPAGNKHSNSESK